MTMRYDKPPGVKFVPFKELSIGETFRMSSEWDFMFSGMKTGLCRKVSARKYRYVDDGMECRIGSINTDVVRYAE